MDREKLVAIGKKLLMVAVAAVALYVPVSDYTTTAETAARWQKEAVASHEQAVYDAGKTGEEPDELEDWVTENALNVALDVWKSLPANVTSALAGLFFLLQALWPVFFKGKSSFFDTIMTFLTDLSKKQTAASTAPTIPTDNNNLKV